VNGEQAVLKDTEIYAAAISAPPTEHAAVDADDFDSLRQQPIKGGIRANLQRRVRELEQTLLEKQRHLVVAKDLIARLESKNKELEERLREASGFLKKKH
jgi:flagellar motility protein MotE (MotC chaperone)